MDSTNIAPKTEDGLGTASGKTPSQESTCWLN
jgi:hypothetical protein